MKDKEEGTSLVIMERVQARGGEEMKDDEQKEQATVARLIPSM